tara:strand:+ start:333 stop:491 length:159 start_codon:yes stop_codon:yes gene_type:complete
MDLYWILNNTPAIEIDFGLYIRKKRQQLKKYGNKRKENKATNKRPRKQQAKK